MGVGDLEKRHLAVGWLSIAVFIGLGILLEALHALKAGYLLDVENETRRHMWTLAHAHGTLIGVMNLALAFTYSRVSAWPTAASVRVSQGMLAGTILVPGGFFLGGLTVYAGDPGLGILLVPPGGLLLLYAGVGASRAVRAHLEVEDGG